MMRGTAAGASGAPDAIAHAAVYLASDEAAFVNGTVIDVHGGRAGVAVIAPRSDNRPRRGGSMGTGRHCLFSRRLSGGAAQLPVRRFSAAAIRLRSPIRKTSCSAMLPAISCRWALRTGKSFGSSAAMIVRA
jgi:hypothetical protein